MFRLDLDWKCYGKQGKTFCNAELKMWHLIFSKLLLLSLASKGTSVKIITLRQTFGCHELAVSESLDLTGLSVKYLTLY